MPLSETQMKYLALAWQCFETEPKIDYEKFHQVAGLKSVASAREMMRITKKKLAEELGEGMGTKASTPSTPKKAAGEGGVAKTPASSRKKGTAKKRGKADVDEDEDENDVSAKKAKVKQEKNEGDEDADGDALS